MQKNFDSAKAFWRMGRGEARSLKQIFNYKLYFQRFDTDYFQDPDVAGAPKLF